MTLFKRKMNERGSAVVEFAVAAPVLVMMIWGMFQVFVVYQANAGMKHALGEAARYATIFPTPSDADIQTKITSSKFGVANGTWGTPVIDNTNAAAASGGYKVVTVSYSQPTDFLMFDGPTVTLTESKRIYLSI